MPFPNRIRYWNKAGVNHLMHLMAQLPIGPFCLVEHAGRRTGMVYQTPIVAFRQGDGYIVALTYGSHVDWYKNILATGKSRVYWHRQWSEIYRIEVYFSTGSAEAFSLMDAWFCGYCTCQGFHLASNNIFLTSLKPKPPSNRRAAIVSYVCN